MAVPISRTISFASSSISNSERLLLLEYSATVFVSVDMLRERSVEGQHPIDPGGVEIAGVLFPFTLSG